MSWINVEICNVIYRCDGTRCLICAYFIWKCEKGLKYAINRSLNLMNSKLNLFVLEANHAQG